MGASCSRGVEEIEDRPGAVACRCGHDASEELKIESPRMPDVHAKSYRDTPGMDDFKEFKEPDHDMDLDSKMMFHSLPRLELSSKRQEITWAPRVSAPVTLHIYDVGTSEKVRMINNVLRPFGAGIFHCGVEIFGREWSFSDTESGLGNGVFSSRPRHCNGHTYFESMQMGKTATPELEVLELVYLLAKVWRVEDYDILTNNCCHFCNELCLRLGAGAIPKWVMNLASAGAAIASANDTTCCRQVAGNCAEHLCCGSPGPTTKPVVVTIAQWDAQPA